MESFAENILGIKKPEKPKIIPPAAVPTVDQARDRQRARDATKYRTGSAATRLASGGSAGGATRAFRLLSGVA